MAKWAFAEKGEWEKLPKKGRGPSLKGGRWGGERRGRERGGSHAASAAGKEVFTVL